MAKVELKQPIVEAIAEEIKDAQSVVLVDYRGLTVAQDTELRKQLREAGVVYKVYKNTMMKRAFELLRELSSKALRTVWKDRAQSLYQKMTRQLRQEFCASSQRMLRHWNSRAALLKELSMTWQDLQNCPRSRQEKNCFPNFLEASSHRLQTLLVLLSRSQSRAAERLRQMETQRKQQRHRQKQLLRQQKLRLRRQKSNQRLLFQIN